MTETTMLWDVADDDPRVKGTKAFVQRDLTGHDPVDLPAGWRLGTLAEVGEEDFAALVQRASVGDAFETTPPEGALAALRELIEEAGETFDPNGWYVVADERGDLGVVLPQVYDDAPHMGTLFYVAVLPERRGEGLGARLHAFGLDELARRGVRRYVGSTDLRNDAMRRAFERNGAQQIRTQTFLER